MDAQKLVEFYRELRDTRNDMIQEQVSIVVHKKASTNQIIVSLMHSNGSVELSKEEFVFEPDYFDEHIFPILYAEYYSHNTDALNFSEYVNPVKRDNRYFVSVSEDTFQMDHVSDDHLKKMEEIKSLIDGEIVENSNKYVKKIDVSRDIFPEDKSIGVLFKDGKLDLDEVERVADEKLQAIVDRGLKEEDLKDSATNKVNLDRVDLLIEKVLKEHTAGKDVPIHEVIEDVTGITRMEEHDKEFKNSEEDPNRRDQDYFERIFLKDSKKIDLDEAEKVADEILQTMVERGVTEEDLKDPITEKINLDRVERLVEKIMKENTIESELSIQEVVEAIAGIARMEKHDREFAQGLSDPDRKDRDYFNRIFLSDYNKIDLDEAEKVADEKLGEILNRGLREEDLKDSATGKVNLDRVDLLREKILMEHTVVKDVPIQEVIENVTGVTSTEEHDKEFKNNEEDPNRRDQDYFERIFLTDSKKIDLDEAMKIATDELDLDKKQVIRENVEKDIPALEQKVKDGVSYKDPEFRELISRMAGVIQGHVIEKSKEEVIEKEEIKEEVQEENKGLSRQELFDSMNRKMRNMPPKVKNIVPGIAPLDLSFEEIRNRVCFEYSAMTFEKRKAFDEYYTSFEQDLAFNSLNSSKKEETDEFNKVSDYYMNCRKRLFDILNGAPLSDFVEIEKVNVPDRVNVLLENAELQDLSYKLARLLIDKEILRSMDEFTKESNGYKQFLIKNEEDYKSLYDEYVDKASKIVSELVELEANKDLNEHKGVDLVIDSNQVSRDAVERDDDLVIDAFAEEEEEQELEPVIVDEKEELVMEPAFVDDEKSQFEEFVEALQLCYGGSIQGETVRVISQPSNNDANKRIVKVGLVGGFSQDEYEFVFDKNEEFDTRIVPTIMAFFKDNVEGISTNLVQAPYKENMSALLLDSRTGSQVLLLDDTGLLKAMEEEALKEEQKEELSSFVR